MLYRPSSRTYSAFTSLSLIQWPANPIEKKRIKIPSKTIIPPRMNFKLLKSINISKKRKYGTGKKDLYLKRNFPIIFTTEITEIYFVPPLSSHIFFLFKQQNIFLNPCISMFIRGYYFFVSFLCILSALFLSNTIISLCPLCLIFLVFDFFRILFFLF